MPGRGLLEREHGPSHLGWWQKLQAVWRLLLPLVEGATVLLLVSTGVLVAGAAGVTGSCALVEGTTVLVLGAAVLVLVLGRTVVVGTAMLDCTVVDGADVLAAGAAVVASGTVLLDCTVVDGAGVLAAGADVLASGAVLPDAGAAVLAAGSCVGAEAPHCGVAWIAVGQDCVQLPVRTMFTVAPCTREQVPQRYTSRSGLSCWHWSPMMRSCSEAETVVSLPSVGCADPFRLGAGRGGLLQVSNSSHCRREAGLRRCLLLGSASKEAPEAAAPYRGAGL